jgi:hypothetical protein
VSLSWGLYFWGNTAEHFCESGLFYKRITQLHIHALVIVPFCGGQICSCWLHLQLADRWSSSHICGLYCRVFIRLVTWLMNLEVPGDQCQLAYRRFTVLILEGGICKWWNSFCISNCMAPIDLHILHILQLEHKHFPEAYIQRCKNENSSRFEGQKCGSFVTSPFVSFFIQLVHFTYLITSLCTLVWPGILCNYRFKGCKNLIFLSSVQNCRNVNC